MAGLFLVLLMVVAALFAPILAPYSYSAQNLDNVNQPPSLAHPMGTDQFGRDILSRVIWGARTALVVLLIVLVLTVIIGIPLGAAAAYFGGLVDSIIMRTADVLFAFPGILLALFISSTVKPAVVEWVKGLEPLLGLKGLARSGVVDYLVVFGALSFVGWPGLARLVRGQMLSLREAEFVLAARAMGASGWRIIFRHLLPNSLAPVVVALSLSAGGIILSEASLSFLGIGIQPPNPSWGNMIYDSFYLWRTEPHVVFGPGLVLALMVYAFNFLGDGINEIMNPQRS
jgi:ABC-type dipeptide/oligopeptide/nickel transport system permease subunit